MSERKKFHRWEPQKVFIQEILGSEEARVTDTMKALKTDHNLYFKRVSVIGVVIDMNITEGKESKKDHGFITIDDATGRINCTLFEPKDFKMIRELTLGKTVIVQGLAYKRTYKEQDDYYIVPEKVREIGIDERNYFLVHTLFLRVRNRLPVKVFPAGLEPVLTESGVTVHHDNGTVWFSIEKTDDERPSVEPAAPKSKESWIVQFLDGKDEKRAAYDDLLAKATKKKIQQNAFEKELVALVNAGTIHEIDGEWYEIAR